MFARCGHLNKNVKRFQYTSHLSKLKLGGVFFWRPCAHPSVLPSLHLILPFLPPPARPLHLPNTKALRKAETFICSNQPHSKKYEWTLSRQMFSPLHLRSFLYKHSSNLRMLVSHSIGINMKTTREILFDIHFFLESTKHQKSPRNLVFQTLCEVGKLPTKSSLIPSSCFNLKKHGNSPRKIVLYECLKEYENSPRDVARYLGFMEFE